LKKITRFNIFALILQLCLKLFSYLLYCPKTFTSFASLLKNIILKPGKFHTNILQGFSQGLKTTPLTEYFRAINQTFD